MGIKKLTKFSRRLALLVASLFFTIVYPDETIGFFNSGIGKLKTYHLVWAYVCWRMIKPLFPRLNKGSQGGKCFSNNFEPIQQNLSKKNLLKKVIRQTDKAELRVVAFWLVLLAIPGILYYGGIISELGIYNAFFVFLLLDRIAVLYWCPFRDWLVKNRCCNDCVVNKWGYLIVASSLIYIPSFWTYSVIFLAALNLIQWEWLRYKHPERFSPLFNKSLACKGKDCATIEFCPKGIKPKK
ncbi:hypothetical protein ACFLZP_03985 [Patescibacteria group bacterium]